MRYLVGFLALLIASGCAYKDSHMADYLIRHPEKLQAALDNLARYQEQANVAATKQVIASEKSRLYSLEAGTVLGAESATRLVIMFSDHNCRFCKIALKTAMSSNAYKEGQLRIIVRELPVVRPDSRALARLALACAKQGKYESFTNLTLGSETTSLDVHYLVQNLGVDQAQLTSDLANSAINRELANNLALAQRLEIKSTPAFISDGKIQRGWNAARPLF